MGKGRVRKYRIYAGSRQQTTNQNSADETIGRRVVVECLSRRLALSRKPLTPNIPYCCYLFVAASRWPFGETTAESQDDDGSDGSRPHTHGANATVPYPDDDRARHRSCSRPAVHVRCMRQHSPQPHVPQTRRRVGDVRQKGHRIAGEEAEGQERRTGITGHRHHNERRPPDQMRHNTADPGWSTTGSRQEGVSTCHLCPSMEVARFAQK